MFNNLLDWTYKIPTANLFTILHASIGNKKQNILTYNLMGKKKWETEPTFIKRDTL